MGIVGGRMTNGRENVVTGRIWSHRNGQIEADIFDLKIENQRLRLFLSDIKRHMETVAPSCYRASTVWFIADRALSAGEGKV